LYFLCGLTSFGVSFGASFGVSFGAATSFFGLAKLILNFFPP